MITSGKKFSLDASIWSGLIAGIVFFILLIMYVPKATNMGTWSMSRALGAFAMGPEVLEPADVFHPRAFVFGFFVHILACFIYAAIINLALHRFYKWIGMIGGAFFGFLIYLFEFNVLTLMFPWYTQFQSQPILWTYVIFGILTARTYKFFE
jgi:hypothetical protein